MTFKLFLIKNFIFFHTGTCFSFWSWVDWTYLTLFFESNKTSHTVACCLFSVWPWIPWTLYAFIHFWNKNLWKKETTTRCLIWIWCCPFRTGLTTISPSVGSLITNTFFYFWIPYFINFTFRVKRALQLFTFFNNFT